MRILQTHLQKNKQTNYNLVIRGTIILIITGVITRVIGFYNRIFLSNLIGAKELGIYQLIFPLYMVAYSFTTFGNELALTKLISEYDEKHNDRQITYLFNICFYLNLMSGMIVSILFYVNSDFLCSRILNAPECSNCLKIISLGIPFFSVKGAIHGFFLGKKNSSVHGISDFLEQLAKITGLYVLSSYICVQKYYPASFAVWGIVIGEIVAFIYSFFTLLRKQRRNVRLLSPFSIPRKNILLFLKNAVPLTTNRFSLTILQSIESIMIPTVLFQYYQNATKSLSIYGVFTGMAFPFIMFPSTITNSLSTMLLPAVSSAKENIQTRELSILCNKSLRFCTLIGLFSLNLFYLFGKDIGNLIFHNRDAGQYLFLLSFLCPFLYLATTLVSILNGLGYATHNLLFTLLTTIIRISFILLFVPRIGMPGYILGLMVSYITLTFVCILKIKKTVELEFPFFQSVFYPTVSFLFNGIIFYFTYQKLKTCTILLPIISLCIVLTIYGIISLLPFLYKLLYSKNHE